jgi:hypothetical protein
MFFFLESNQLIFQTISDLLPPYKIIGFSKNLGESKHFKFEQYYRKNYKDL